MSGNMTEGSITPSLIKFTIPLVLGNLFQLTYNAADSIVVGKYLGDDALAAVGTAGPVMNLAILFISGMCMGAGIIMSQMYGAGKNDRLEKQISTTLIGGLIFSVIVSVLAVCLATPILWLIQVPEDISSIATSYLRVIFLGLIFTFIYNFFSNTLRALGDSKTPLYFLIISSVLNILGDIFFVVVLGLGVRGCATSTVISEALCCIFCGIYVKKRVPLLCLGKKWRIFEKSLLAKTVKYSITSATQLMCVQLGKILVQCVVNTKGVDYMAAFTVINRIDDFAMTVQQNIAHAMTTFIAQNKGAKKPERMRSGFKCGMMMEMCYSMAVFIITFFGADTIMKIFVKADSTNVINLGVSYLIPISVMYFLPGITNGVQGFFRGIGDLKVTLISTITNMGFRAAFAFLFIGIAGFGFSSLAYANMLGWFAMMAFELPLLIKILRGNQKLC